MTYQKIIILLFLFIGVITACNDPETPPVQDLSGEAYKAHLKKVGEAFRVAARLENLAARTSGVLKDPAELEAGMTAQLTPEYGAELVVSIENLKSTPAYEYILQTKEILSNSNSSKSTFGRMESANFAIDEVLQSFEGAFGYMDVSPDFREYIRDINSKVSSIATEFMKEANNEAEIIGGEPYIPADSTYEESFSKQIKSGIGIIEDRIMTDENLADEDKQNLFRYTTAMLMNIDVIMDYNRQLDSIFLINSKTSGFFKKIGKLFKNVVSAIFTTVVTGVFTTLGAIGGFFAAGIPGAIAGGVIGFSIGIGLSESLMCDWGYAMC